MPAPTVVMLTHRFDPTADAVVDALHRRGTELFRCDAAEFPERLTVGAELVDGRWSGRLQTHRRRLDLDDVSGIYYRRPTGFTFDNVLTDAERRWAATQARMGFGGLLAAVDRWLNHPHHIGHAEYKPVQLRHARACRLRVPRTLVTNDPAAARAFVTEVGPAVCKPFGGSSVRDEEGLRFVFTSLVGPELCDEPSIARTMHLFQQAVPKDHEVRLTVVDGHFFAARIDAASAQARVDWRADYGALRYTPVETPASVRSGVSALLDRLGLRFGALDFVVDPTGDWWFLEINPNGQWAWIEDETGLPIAAALAAALDGGGPS